jgi:hypothetical protein
LLLLLSLTTTAVTTVRAAAAAAASLDDALQTPIAFQAETSVTGESALIDKETGRIFWEGGSSTTVSESVGSKVHQLGTPRHARATILTALLLVAVAGTLARLVQAMLVLSPDGPRPHRTQALLFLFRILWLLPKFDRWFVVAIAVLYLLEAYACGTRRYLANVIHDTNSIEAFLTRLQEEPPVVEWKVRAFHYETPKLLVPFQLLHRARRMMLRRKGKEDENDEELPSSSPFQRKKITHKATGRYQFQQVVDKTIAGVWKRAPVASPPFTKLLLTKTLVLANAKARQDYFRQQSDFVTEHAQDELAEFSTSISVDGFKPRMLAVKEGQRSTRLFKLHFFWIFTLLGLTVPYRTWFNNHCDELRVTIVKETYADRLTLAQPSSWFSSSSKPTVDEPAKQKFRSLMQNLMLYAKQEPERKVATEAVLEEVQEASILAGMKDVENDVSTVEAQKTTITTTTTTTQGSNDNDRTVS